MSRSYAIRLPLNILLAPEAREKLGSFSLSFELLEILPVEKMRQIIHQKLLEKGFVDSADGLVMPCKSGESAVFDVETMTVHLQVQIPDGMIIRINDDYLQDWRNDIKKAEETGELLSAELTERAAKTLGSEAAKNLSELAMEARERINAALKETYREAIREKAGSLGSVSNVTESSDGSTYRIRIEVSA